ncbi:MAG: type II secretion system F family protein [Candidatus Sumerlaeia bacterium]
MPLFAYSAKDNKGEEINGTMEAESDAAVISRLQTMGYYPINVAAERVREVGPHGVSGLWKKITGRPVSLTDITTFNRQLADLLNAGIPLVRALQVIVSQTSNPVLQNIIQQVNTDVQGGHTLANALAKHPKVFNKLFCSMVKAGEAGGMLDEVLERLADFAELEEELRSKVKSSLAYPVIMICAGSAAILILLTFVVPKIVSIFAEMNQALPPPTLVLLAVSSLLSQYWWAILGAAAVGVGVFINFAKTDEGRLLIDRTLLKLPLVRHVIVLREISRFSRTLGSLLHNGVPILNSLEITRDVMTNKLFAAEVDKLIEEVAAGAGVAQPLKASPYFPPVVTNMIAIGEETGRLDQVLIKIAGSYEVQLERTMKSLTSLFEPIIIICMGLVVGFVVIAILLPIFTLDPTAGG